MILCLDTWILVEIHNQNPKFLHIFDEEIVITELMLAEFYGVICRKHNKLTADYWLGILDKITVRVPRDVLMKAAHFRVQKKDDVSFFDCAGYIYAQEHGYAFVTGDKAFKGLPGVRYMGEA